ncbi:hypothetical protein GTO89_08660 [Heliobacterium gestii]|uniref:Uncharacterized protein n=1 Tax=Heliomicrobium gestii TaxID=2699 RepID=A0A845LF83_HELGE|nr:hypothetical protein [Heliomicrobium gestii]MBM7866615.1 phosphoglycerol transferase [Heliomicrobium gestii]MZP43105.1 hypothetical protein [Heliomicrobium gestii]
MIKQREVNNILNRFTPYLIALLACSIVVYWRFELWRADLSIPFSYHGDSLGVAATIKAFIESGWYTYTPFLGAPFGRSPEDYAMFEGLSFLMLKAITMFTNDYAVTLNVFYLLTFLLTTVTTLYVFRHFGISNYVAIPVSVLYSIAPYHILRGTFHFFLSVYFLVPLIVMVILWIYRDEDFLFNHQLSISKLVTAKSKNLQSILICVLIASTGIYYAFFACFFLIVVGIAIFIIKRKINNLVSSFLLILTMIATGLINALPSLIYQFYNGKNYAVSQRLPWETEVYALKITQLFIPPADYGIGLIAKIRNVYSAFPLINENSFSYLGVIGCIGFLILTVLLLFNEKEENKLLHGSVLNNLSRLNIFAILFATIGGFSSIFSILVTPQIRANNRISIFIAYFSLFAVAIILNNFFTKYVYSNERRVAFSTFMSFLLLFGSIDQIPKAITPNYNELKAVFLRDAAFVSKIEEVTSDGAMVLQLPYMSWPEHGPLNEKMGDYQLYRGYLHSNKLRWTYGAVRGRPEDIWYKEVTDKPLPEMVKSITVAGFSGIYIDRYGYKDNGAQLEREIALLLNKRPIESDDKRLAYYDLRDYQESLKRIIPEKEWQTEKEKLLEPVFVQWNPGFSAIEGTVQANWHWCSSKGTLQLINASKQTKTMQVDMSVSTGFPETSDLSIQSDLWNEQLGISSSPTRYTKQISVPPGRHTILFTTDAPRIQAPSDPRDLRFKIDKFSLNEVKSGL